MLCNVVVMPSERHLMRQVEWKNRLEKHGFTVFLEKPFDIKGAKVVVDVVALAEGKTFLIEVGNIEDERKHVLMEYYAQDNPNIEFVHEPYETNRIPFVLEQINAYLNSEEFKEELKERERRFKE